VAVKLAREGSHAASLLLRHEREVLDRHTHEHLVRKLPDVVCWHPKRGRIAAEDALVLELAEGSLEDEVGKCDWRRARRRAVEVGAAVSHLHRRAVLHLDLKPANVLCVDGVTRVADLGTSWARWPLEPPPYFGGTRRYMAPEQRCLARSAIGPWTDVYAFAWLLAELVAPGARVPKHLAAWFERATTVDPHDRFTDVRAAVAALPRSTTGGPRWTIRRACDPALATTRLVR